MKKSNKAIFIPGEGFSFGHADETNNTSLSDMESIKKDKFTLLRSSSDEFTFATVLTDYDNDGEDAVDIGIGVKLDLTYDQIIMVFSTGVEDNRTFVKTYDLPAPLHGSKFPSDIKKGVVIEQHYLNIEISSENGKGTLDFHFNGEGTIYNDLIFGEDSEEWNGYFEVEDFYNED